MRWESTDSPLGDTVPATLEAKNVAERQENHESATLEA